MGLFGNVHTEQTTCSHSSHTGTRICQLYYGDKIKEYKMGRAFGMNTEKRNA